MTEIPYPGGPYTDETVPDELYSQLRDDLDGLWVGGTDGMQLSLRTDGDGYDVQAVYSGEPGTILLQAWRTPDGLASWDRSLYEQIIPQVEAEEFDIRVARGPYGDEGIFDIVDDPSTPGGPRPPRTRRHVGTGGPHWMLRAELTYPLGDEAAAAALLRIFASTVVVLLDKENDTPRPITLCEPLKPRPEDDDRESWAEDEEGWGPWDIRQWLPEWDGGPVPLTELAQKTRVPHYFDCGAILVPHIEEGGGHEAALYNAVLHEGDAIAVTVMWAGCSVTLNVLVPADDDPEERWPEIRDELRVEYERAGLVAFHDIEPFHAVELVAFDPQENTDARKAGRNRVIGFDRPGWTLLALMEIPAGTPYPVVQRLEQLIRETVVVKPAEPLGEPYVMKLRMPTPTG